MSFNTRDYVSDDHIESIGEIAKSQSAIIQALSLENSKLETQLQQKENIIKEARELVEGRKEHIEELSWVEMKVDDYIEEQDELLEIFDKENK